MKPFTKGFIISSLAYLVFTGILGAAFILISNIPNDISISTYGLLVSVVHSFLLGFVTMMIFGVSYHLIPIFSERDFYSPLLAFIHLALSNIGTLGIIIFMLFLNYAVVKVCALIVVISLLVFVFNMMMTFLSKPRKSEIYNPFGKGDKEADKVAINFTRWSIIYLLIGCPIGAAMFFKPALIASFRPIHAHINLMGFVSLMIFGVSYHMFPRFTQRPLFSVKMARWQFWLANIGLVGMAVSWWFAGSASSAGILTFGIISGISAYLYVHNVWKTLS